ncbi:collagen alpha-3(VI) chain-like [Cheilinus undulatus]|uniref:collagen alpha-3(VI) chain-like n=1 Tax=Cheilinus undulatus TaxID=241271 RepID=UPI001BD40F81|nr:collagen alpha-3(VI) chain-like [Cheilinus undulatus]
MRGPRLLPLCVLLGVLYVGLLPNLHAQEVLAIGKRDIIFLIDGTMGATVLISVREFIRRFVDIMPIGPDDVQVGVAMFTNTPQLEMYLNTYGSKESLLGALGNIRPKSGQVINIGTALDFVRTNMLRADKGSRLQQGVPQLLLLMTSKKSTDSVEEPANALRRMGVLTLAAGSRHADEQELKNISFAESVVFRLNDFRILPRNPGAIIDALTTLSGVAATEAPTEPPPVVDIVFLVDGSNYIGSNFPYVRDFIINVVNQSDVGPDKVQIGLLQFAEHPRIEFYLNSNSKRQDVVDKLNQLRLTGGSTLNTGAAMNYALANMFQPSTGSRRRQGVQQVLILVIAGPTSDQVKSVADKLALAGVLTFTVSSGQADPALLRTVAFVPELAYHNETFSNLPAFAEEILPKLTRIVIDI